MTREMKRGTSLLILGFLFGVAETIYFGGNFTLASNLSNTDEGICDIIALIISFYGLSLINKANKEEVI